MILGVGPDYGIDSVKSPEEEEDKFGISCGEVVLADGVNKRRFTEASQKIFKPSQAKRKDVLTEKECEVMAEITTFVKAAHVTYTVKGFDRKGEFEVLRRYSEFHALHNALVNRFPGIYVPAIPPKKAMGNTDLGFVIERRYFLDRFLSLVSEIDYLAFSEEFKLFMRNSGDFDKVRLGEQLGCEIDTGAQL